MTFKPQNSFTISVEETTPKILRPSKYQQLKSQFDDIVIRSRKRVNVLPEKQEEKELNKLPQIQNSLSPKKKKSIEFLSPFRIRSRASNSKDKTNVQNLKEYQVQSAQFSDSNNERIGKKTDNQFKIYKKPPKTPRLFQNIKFWKQFQPSEFLLPEEVEIEEENYLQIYWKHKNIFVKLVKGNPEKLQPLEVEYVEKIYGKVMINSCSFFLVQNEFNRSLAKMIEDFGNFSQKLISKYVTQIVEGVISLHKNHFIHNKLTLDNIYTNMKGDIRIDMIAGSSKRIEKKELQKNGFYFHCPQCLLRGSCSEKNDIWSIGCIALSLVHGKKIHPQILQHPYNKKIDEESHNKQILNEIDKKYKKKCSKQVKKKLNIELSTYLKSFVNGCLEVNENLRLSLLEVRNHIFLID